MVHLVTKKFVSWISTRLKCGASRTFIVVHGPTKVRTPIMLDPHSIYLQFNIQDYEDGASDAICLKQTPDENVHMLIVDTLDDAMRDIIRIGQQEQHLPDDPRVQDGEQAAPEANVDDNVHGSCPAPILQTLRNAVQTVQSIIKEAQTAVDPNENGVLHRPKSQNDMQRLLGAVALADKLHIATPAMYLLQTLVGIVLAAGWEPVIATPQIIFVTLCSVLSERYPHDADLMLLTYSMVAVFGRRSEGDQDDQDDEGPQRE